MIYFAVVVCCLCCSPQFAFEMCTERKTKDGDGLINYWVCIALWGPDREVMVNAKVTLGL